MATYLITIGLIFAILLTGIGVERFYRRFARRNPQLGPFRPSDKQDCSGCVAGSGCGDAATTACTNPQPAQTEIQRNSRQPDCRHAGAPGVES